MDNKYRLPIIILIATATVFCETALHGLFGLGLRCYKQDAEDRFNQIDKINAIEELEKKTEASLKRSRDLYNEAMKQPDSYSSAHKKSRKALEEDVITWLALERAKNELFGNGNDYTHDFGFKFQERKIHNFYRELSRARTKRAVDHALHVSCEGYCGNKKTEIPYLLEKFTAWQKKDTEALEKTIELFRQGYSPENVAKELKIFPQYRLERAPSRMKSPVPLWAQLAWERPISKSEKPYFQHIENLECPGIPSPNNVFVTPH